LNRTLSIAVVGCGSAGPAAALFLARLGHQVEIFERAPWLRPLGAGFLLQPTGMSVLAELGLLDAVLALGAKVRRLVSETRSRRILDLAYEELGPDLFGLGLHRPVLLSAFSAALEAARVPLRLGTNVLDVKEQGQGAILECEGGRLGPYDLVVVANGARSELRQRISPETPAPRYPWGALWFIGEDDTGIGGERLYQRVDGSTRMLGILPTGRERRDGPPLCSLFWSVPLARIDEVNLAGLQALKAEMLRLAPQVAPLLEQIRSFDQLTVAMYFDTRMRRWSRGSVVFLGDAAHATSPQLGQGVNLALWDAQTLAGCLRATSTLAEALALYDHSRQHHLRFYQRMTRWLTPFFQSSFHPFGWMRDIGFPILQSVGPLRREMIRTMAGLKRGIFRRSLSVPWPPREIPGLARRRALPPR
jgi:2-polyprenyl-6-methoxyphenol hydroxylase-like FAD-dependent oxidoreductase